MNSRAARITCEAREDHGGRVLAIGLDPCFADCIGSAPDACIAFNPTPADEGGHAPLWVIC